MNKLLLSILMILMTLFSFGQNEHRMVRQGNRLYSTDEFTDAEANYKKALEIDQKHYQASFNLGDSYFKQGRFDEAITQFTIAANSTDNLTYKNRAYYNLGNSNLEAFKSIKESADQEEMKKKSQYLDQSIEAYKEALKVDPTDMESKYNLSYALKNKPKNEGQSDQQNEDQQKKEDQEKDKQDKKEEKKDKKDDKKQDQQEPKNNDKKEGDKDKQPQPKPEDQKMNKKEAEKLLKAQEQKEKEVQAKVMKQKTKAVKVKIEKEW